MCKPKWDSISRAIKHCFKVSKEWLTSLRSKVNFWAFIRYWTKVGSKHQVKVSAFCPFSRISCLWIVRNMTFNEGFHSFIPPRFRGKIWNLKFRGKVLIWKSVSYFFKIFFNDFISSKSLSCLLIIDQCIRKWSKMSTCLPGSWMSNNCCIHKNHIISLLSKMLNPKVWDIFFE